MTKNIIASLYIIAILRFLFSSELEKDIVIPGKAHNAKSPHISLNRQSVPLNAEGEFQYSVDLKKPAYLEVDSGKKRSSSISGPVTSSLSKLMQMLN